VITVVSSAKATVQIGDAMPVVIIGERINPTGRKRLAAALMGGDLGMLRDDALRQVEAGAQVLDINVGMPGIDEAAVLAAAVREVQGSVDVPLCIDTSSSAALDAALSAYQGKALVNSVTGEDGSLERVLPIVRHYGAAVIGLAHDERGISMWAEERLAAARKIVDRALAMGIAAEDVIIDPLALTVGADAGAGVVTLETIRLVREELGANMTLGASNVSFGLPDRETLNATFLAIAVALGVTCPICNPLDRAARKALLGADLLLGRDEYGGQWIRHYRTAKSRGIGGAG
jgi:5-methyltetrahydrofolate--homocysteine methyltransferase